MVTVDSHNEEQVEKDLKISTTDRWTDAKNAKLDIDIVKKSFSIFDDVNSPQHCTNNKIEMHRQLCEELNKIYEQKNSDYGDSFGKTFNLLGIISAVTRITDKYNRLVELSTKPDEERKVQNETIEDTLLDMANYCMMTVIELRKNKHNKN